MYREKHHLANPLFSLAFLLFPFMTRGQHSTPVLPEPRQVVWQQMETNAFIHFTVNTFTGKEWGNGKENPAIFNPTRFDAEQWVRILKQAGFEMAIITAKHHDGFCLWPSAYTDHSVKSSPWKNGKGDCVKALADACRKHGLKFGFYLSPWDQHEPSYGTDSYNDFYKNQLTELLTQYGEISEVWFDGAKGEGQKDMEYDFEGYWALVRKYQPKAVIFSDAGPDVRWVGNEKGNAAETCWSTIDRNKVTIGGSHASYLNTGDPDGPHWVPAETDVSIRPGWFYHPEEDGRIRSSRNLVNLYYSSVGRNSLLLLNVPPDTTGLITPADSASLVGFRRKLDRTFSENLLKPHVPASLSDEKLETFVGIDTGKPLSFTFSSPVRFNRIMLQENINHGQRLISGRVEYSDGKNWLPLSGFTTVGYKRLLKTTEILAHGIRIFVDEANGKVEMAGLGLFWEEPQEEE